MAMKKCKDCGAEVSQSAKICPKCGKKLKYFTGLRVFLGIIIILFGLGILGSAVNTSNNTLNTSPDVSQNVSANTKVNQKVNLEKFNQIKIGMTYEEVVSIIGEEGTLSTESAYENASMKIYYWYAENGISNATVSFMNGKVDAKSQLGLK